MNDLEKIEKLLNDCHEIGIILANMDAEIAELDYRIKKMIGENNKRISNKDQYSELLNKIEVKP